MRNKREVLEKYQEVRANRLKKRKEQFLSKLARNCQHNTRMRVKGQGTVGFCQNPVVLHQAKTKVFVCSDDDTAKRCRVFSCRNSHQSVEDDFESVLRSPARCGNDYPKLAMLIWFLQDYPNASKATRFGYEVGRFFSSLWRMLTFKWW